MTTPISSRESGALHLWGYFYFGVSTKKLPATANRPPEAENLFCLGNYFFTRSRALARMGVAMVVAAISGPMKMPL